MSDINRTRQRARAYSKAKTILRHKYPAEYQQYLNTQAWGQTRQQKHNSTLRYLRFRHPIVFKRLYCSFLELEEA